MRRSRVLWSDRCTSNHALPPFPPERGSSGWRMRSIRGLLCTMQMADQAHELAALCPASTVGEWSAAPPPDICELGPSGRPTRREFFELQLRLWHAATTHGSFFWCWSDNSGPDWCLRALVPGRREAISSAAQESSAAWTTNYTRPSIEVRADFF